MPKPFLIPVIPPVTIGGSQFPVVANSFDPSGNFRQRNGSFKRPRMEDGGGAGGDGYYDLSRCAAAPTLPAPSKLDVAKIRELMVKANDVASTIRSK
jgi:hypothetical protein